MIRHGSSFLISLIIHFFLFASIFFSWNSLLSTDKEKKSEKKISVNLLEPTTKKIAKITDEKISQQKPIFKKKIIDKKNQIVKKEINAKKIGKINIKEKEILKKKEEEKIEESAKFEQLNKLEELKKQDQLRKATQSQKNEQDELARKVRDIILKNKYYPRSAKRRGIEGEVLVKFILTKDGKAKSIKTISNYTVLNDSLKKTIAEISGDFPKPKSEFLIQVNIIYSLKR